ncbi:MAG: hypothetical protein MSH15_07910 [Oscillospiraceae bacterium]|nr:hypothetical protein [Oscillospiraceae bacterium]
MKSYIPALIATFALTFITNGLFIAVACTLICTILASVAAFFDKHTRRVF